MKAMPIRDNRDGAGKTIPDPENFGAIEAEHGPLPHDATVQRAAERYRLGSGAKTHSLMGTGKAAGRINAGDGQDRRPGQRTPDLTITTISGPVLTANCAVRPAASPRSP
jgi:hypothetical protein